ncbi:MAG: hypothetical protein ACOC5S_03300 [Acidobacteriota bacterium]
MKNRSFWILAFFISFVFVNTTSLLQAHKLELKMTPNYPVVVVEAGYSGHDHRLAGADVFVYAPEDTEKAFQTGKTDLSGRFAFIPQKLGDWRVVADDGTGHRSEKVLTLKEDFFLQKEKTPETETTGESTESEVPTEAGQKETAQKPEAALSKTPIPVLWKALLGMSLIFGASGILYRLKARKQSRKPR